MKGFYKDVIRLPRMRGDRPRRGRTGVSLPLFTPHARGSTVFYREHVIPTCVYPACAGIDRTGNISMAMISSLPRMRGDRPHTVGLNR